MKHSWHAEVVLVLGLTGLTSTRLVNPRPPAIRGLLQPPLAPHDVAHNALCQLGLSGILSFHIRVQELSQQASWPDKVPWQSVPACNISHY